MSVSEVQTSDRITKTIDINAPVDRVWRAISDHREFGEWFKVTLDQPFVAGQPSTGHIEFRGNRIAWNADIVAVEPPHRFAFRWRPYAVDPAIDYSAEPKTLVEFSLEPDGDRTRLTIVESGFAGIPAHRRAEAYRMDDQGWSKQAENVRDYVER